MGRVRPNVLVTRTPGTGKTTTATGLAEATKLRLVNIGDLVREKNIHDGWDEQYDCHVINEDLVCDELEDVMIGGGLWTIMVVTFSQSGGLIASWCFKPTITILYDRLTERVKNFKQCPM